MPICKCRLSELWTLPAEQGAERNMPCLVADSNPKRTPGYALFPLTDLRFRYCTWQITNVDQRDSHAWQDTVTIGEVASRYG